MNKPIYVNFFNNEPDIAINKEKKLKYYILFQIKII